MGKLYFECSHRIILAGSADPAQHGVRVVGTASYEVGNGLSFESSSLGQGEGGGGWQVQVVIRAPLMSSRLHCGRQKGRAGGDEGAGSHSVQFGRCGARIRRRDSRTNSL